MITPNYAKVISDHIILLSCFCSSSPATCTVICYSHCFDYGITGADYICGSHNFLYWISIWEKQWTR